jgi:predicted membrane protein DUF2142
VRRPPLLLLAGWLLLVTAWLVANPPFSGPDEGSHYLRALQVGRGHLITDHRPELAVADSQRRIEWARRLTYSVRVPAGLAPLPFGCYLSNPRASASCLDRFVPPGHPTDTVTPVGNYEPLPYVPSGLALRLEDSPAGALRLARVANAGVALALLALALALAWDPLVGAPSLLGLALAVTPMALYCSGARARAPRGGSGRRSRPAGRCWR